MTTRYTLNHLIRSAREKDYLVHREDEFLSGWEIINPESEWVVFVTHNGIISKRRPDVNPSTDGIISPQLRPKVAAQLVGLLESD